MRGPDDARSAILASIRASLAASSRHDPVYAAIHAGEGRHGTRALPLVVAGNGYGLAAEWVPDAGSSPVEQFGARLEAVGGRLIVADDLAGARAAVFRILREEGARRAALSDSPLVAEVIAAGADPPPCELLVDPPRSELLGADAGISSAQWAIAESGTLVLESSAERNRLASLLPPVHVVVLDTGRLCDTLGAVLARLRSAGTLESRAITFITGPSRTADIEQVLVTGVHGPRKLYVVLIQQGP